MTIKGRRGRKKIYSEGRKEWCKTEVSGGDQSPPKSHSPSLFSLSLFTVKTLSSNRSYLKQPAACKNEPIPFVDLVGVILASAAPECLKGNKVRQYRNFYFYVFTQFPALQFLYVLFLNVKEKQQQPHSMISAVRCIVSAYLFTPYSDPTTSGCIATHVTTWQLTVT